MAFLTKVIAVTEPGSTGNQAYTGAGFQPKAIIFFGTQNTGIGSSAGLGLAVGFAVSSSSRAAVAVSAEDAQGTSDTDRRHDNTKCITLLDFAQTVICAADFVSMDSDGFTINWTTIGSAREKFWALCLGGSDLTNVAIKELSSPTSTGNVGYTGVGFQPDCILALTTAQAGATSGATETNVRFGLGFATSSSSRRVVGLQSDNNVGTSNSARKPMTDKVITTNGLIEADLVSMDADGFTLNWTTAAGSARGCWVLCLKGGQYTIGTITQPASTGGQAYSVTAFEPKGLLFLSGQSTGAGSADDLRFAMGAFGGGVNSGIWVGDDDAEDVSNADQIYTTTVIEFADPGITSLAIAYVSSVNSDGFSLDWTSSDGTARQIYFLAFGDTIRYATPIPVRAAFTTPTRLLTFSASAILARAAFTAPTAGLSTAATPLAAQVAMTAAEGLTFRAEEATPIAVQVTPVAPAQLLAYPAAPALVEAALAQVQQLLAAAPSPLGVQAAFTSAAPRLSQAASPIPVTTLLTAAAALLSSAASPIGARATVTTPSSLLAFAAAALLVEAAFTEATGVSGAVERAASPITVAVSGVTPAALLSAAADPLLVEAAFTTPTVAATYQTAALLAAVALTAAPGLLTHAASPLTVETALTAAASRMDHAAAALLVEAGFTTPATALAAAATPLAVEAVFTARSMLLSRAASPLLVEVLLTLATGELGEAQELVIRILRGTGLDLSNLLGLAFDKSRDEGAGYEAPRAEGQGFDA